MNDYSLMERYLLKFPSYLIGSSKARIKYLPSSEITNLNNVFSLDVTRELFLKFRYLCSPNI